jgi:hypothetical protein
VLNLNGDPLFWHSTWDAAVTWAMKRGGDLDVLFQPYFRSDGALVIEGDIDVYGDAV